MAHHHHHQCDHAVGDYNRAFGLGVVLNVIFVVVELIFGVVGGSLALLADAGHNLSDVLSLMLAWGANVLANRPATTKRTYGFRRATILASLLSATLLLFALGGIAWEAVGRFFSSEPVSGPTVIVVAAIGFVINAATALLFVKGQHHDLNIKGAFLHMAADAGVSLGVVVAGIIIMATGWLWIDPAISLMIVAIILVGTWSLLRDSANLAVDAVPDNIDPQEVRTFLANRPGVTEVHDLHIWALSTTNTALTVHLVIPEAHNADELLEQTTSILNSRFGIDHSTIQIERGTLAHPYCEVEI